MRGSGAICLSPTPQTGEAKDLTPKLDVNTPPAPFGGSNDYAFSPDGKELAFTAEPLKTWPGRPTPTSGLFLSRAASRKTSPPSNPGADAQPAYSPDGKWLAYVSQARAGFESDQCVLKVMLRSSGATYELTKVLDRPVLSFAWAHQAQGRHRRSGNRTNRRNHLR